MLLRRSYLVVLCALSSLAFGCPSKDNSTAKGGAGKGGASGGDAGQGSGGKGGTGAAGMGTTDTFEPKFSVIFKEIIVNTGCNGGSYCHGSGALTGGLVMTDKATTYSLLVNMPAMGMNLPPGGTNCKDISAVRVIPGDPDNSLIMKKLTMTMPPCGTQMPPTGALDPKKIEQVRTWIANGAMDD